MLSKEERKHLDDLIVKIKEGDREALEEFTEKIDMYLRICREYTKKLNDTGILVEGNPFEIY